MERVAARATRLMARAPSGGASSARESSCRSASCGTCLVQVREGAEHLSPAGARELDFLSVLDDASDQRLACQARLLASGPGRCVLHTTDEG